MVSILINYLNLPVIAMTICLAGCIYGSNHNQGYNRATGGGNAIMLAGVIRADDAAGTGAKKAPVNQMRWTQAIEDSLRSNSRRDFVAYRHTTRSLGEFHARLLADYHDDEFLNSESIAVLSGSGLPARYVFFATLDGPHDKPKRVVRHTSRNAAGEVVGDRSSITYYRRRDITITGNVFDMRTGQRVWQRTLASNPVASRTYTEYHGSSVAGSVAALFANRFVNGKEDSRYPSPPSTAVTMRELTRELVYQLFQGPNQL